MFSIAITACLAKFSTSAICLSVKGRTSWRYIVIDPMNWSSFNIGTITSVRAPPTSAISTTLGTPARYAGLSLTSGQMYDPACLHGGVRAAQRMRTDRYVLTQGRQLRRNIIGAGDVKHSPSHSCRKPKFASQTRQAFSSIFWNTGSSSPGDELMTSSTSEVAVCCSRAVLRLVEQPGVLDRDHGLVGEGLHQLDDGPDQMSPPPSA